MNKILIAIMVVVCTTTCTKTEYITHTNPPDAHVDIFSNDGMDFRFMGTEVISGKIITPNDTGYAIKCKTNGMQLGFEFRIHELKVDSLYVLKGHAFSFWKSSFEYQASDICALHITKKDGDYYSGYCIGWVENNALFKKIYVGGTFDRLYFPAKPY